MLGLLVDVDHVLADPIYDAMRCSIGFHPLHSFYAVLLYCLLCVFKPVRLLGIGLLIHMLLDALDCLMMPTGLAQLGGFFPY